MFLLPPVSSLDCSQLLVKMPRTLRLFCGVSFKNWEPENLGYQILGTDCQCVSEAFMEKMKMKKCVVLGEGKRQYDREISKPKRGRLVCVFGNGLFGFCCQLSACMPVSLYA